MTEFLLQKSTADVENAAVHTKKQADQVFILTQGLKSQIKQANILIEGIEAKIQAIKSKGL